MTNKILMCRPTYFDVNYVINPHMEGNLHAVDKARAIDQWEALYSIISSLTKVELMQPIKGLPDMVFTANAAALVDKTAWISRFRNVERQGEEKYFELALAQRGYNIIHVANPGFNFEGAGDCLKDANDRHWIGYGQRSNKESIDIITHFFRPTEFHMLRLATPDFYHLDTCFCPLSKGHILWYPQAFDTSSYWEVASIVGKRTTGVAHEVDAGPDMLIDVDEEDAFKFACNAVCIGDHIVCNIISDKLRGQLTDAGYNVIMTDTSEFLKSGGSVKCLTLELS